MASWRNPTTKITSVSSHRFTDARPAGFKDAKRRANEYMNQRHEDAGLGGYEPFQAGSRGVEKARERVKERRDPTYRDPTAKHTAVSGHVQADKRPSEFVAARYDVNAHMNARHEAAGLGPSGAAGTKQTIRDMKTAGPFSVDTAAIGPSNATHQPRDRSPVPASVRGYPEGYRAPATSHKQESQDPRLQAAAALGKLQATAVQGEEAFDMNMMEFTCEIQRPANRGWGINVVDAGDALLVVAVDKNVAASPPVQTGDVFIAAMDCADGAIAEGAGDILDLFSRSEARIQLMVLRGSELGRALVQL